MTATVNKIRQKLGIEPLSYKAYIFDLDGTLVNSDEAIYEVFKPWCKTHNLDLHHVLTLCRGGKLIDFLPDLVPHLDAQQEFDYLLQQEASIKTGLKPIAGASAFLTRLTELNKPWGIATSCALPVAQFRLSSLYVDTPDVFVTSEEVSKGKPDPEHFVKAANRLGADAVDCLAFEDSNNGVRSALSAGCKVVVVGQHCDIEHANIVARVDNYYDLLELVSSAQEHYCG